MTHYKAPLPLCTQFFRALAVIAISLISLTHLISHATGQSENQMLIKQPPPSAGLQLRTGLVNLPNDTSGQKAVRIYPTSKDQFSSPWSVYRSWPGGYLDVYYQLDGQVIKRLPISLHWRRNVHPMLIFADQQNLWFVGYDVIRNIPSGRSLTVSEPGFDIFKLNLETKEQPELVTKGLDLGGIDTMLYGRVDKDEITLCGGNSCATTSPEGKVQKWDLDILSGFEFIEVAFSSSSAYALVRQKQDDQHQTSVDGKITPYSFAKLTQNKSEVIPINDGRIPYYLSVQNDTPSWLLADTQEDYQNLLAYELVRMPFNGLMDFGSNNMEGRIAWSQIYYLNGLLSLLNSRYDLNIITDKEFRKNLQNRLGVELNLLAKLSSFKYPGYLVKRYSLEREPLLFALHLGRIAKTLARAREQGFDDEAYEAALMFLKKELHSLEHTAEESSDSIHESVSYADVKYRKNIPFWADGANVPYNYISGYIDGLLSVENSVSTVSFATALSKSIRTQENLYKLPDTWRYWGGVGHNGWVAEEGISSNTPAWGGDKMGQGFAHITYRTMDAMALINLYRQSPETTPIELMKHFRKLAERGLLLPFVNEELSMIGMQAQLEPPVAHRFARSATPWEIQSQIWALSALIKTSLPAKICTMTNSPSL